MFDCIILLGIVNFRLLFCYFGHILNSKGGVIMDYISFSKKFFSATGIPVNLLYEGRPVYSALGELLSFQPKESWKRSAGLCCVPSLLP